jgi:dipeptidyl aminopeptidase/acylaminoacyl peptidase
MIRLVPFTVLSLAVAGGLSAQKTKTGTGLPPLIDREELFGNPEIAGAQISPDGKYLVFLKPWKDTRNVWVKKTEEPFSAAHLLTAETARPVAAFLWSRDAKYVLFVKDNGGDENFNAYAVDPNAPPAPGSEAPPARDLTGVKGAVVRLYSVPKNDLDVMYIGLNDRDKAWHNLYKLKLSTGQRMLVRRNTEKIAAWIFDESGQLRLAARTADNGDQELLRVDAAGRAWLKERSPLTAAGNIRTPVLVVQGANDPRVNRAEAEQIVIALRDRGLPVEYMLAPDEGHGYARPLNNMAMFMAAEKFFAQQLDGRYQESGKPEVVARLKEITVDPKTVVLSRKLDAEGVKAQ